MEFGEQIPVTCASGALCSALLDGMRWVKRAVEVIHAPPTYRSCSSRDVEEILSECQVCILKLHLCIHSTFGNYLIYSCHPKNIDFFPFYMQTICISFPVVVGQLQNTIQNHR